MEEPTLSTLIMQQSVIKGNFTMKHSLMKKCKMY